MLRTNDPFRLSPTPEAKAASPRRGLGFFEGDRGATPPKEATPESELSYTQLLKLIYGNTEPSELPSHLMPATTTTTSVNPREILATAAPKRPLSPIKEEAPAPKKGRKASTLPTEAKAQLKLERNRISAQLSRLRKKELVEGLETQVTDLKKSEKTLQELVSRLITENTQLRNNNAQLTYKVATLEAAQQVTLAPIQSSGIGGMRR